MSLSPDEYFIKPQLKEYEFNPKHKMQKLQQGENAHISWTAKRVAFSILGKIVSLNGQAEPGTTLRGKYFGNFTYQPLQCLTSGSYCLKKNIYEEN